MKIAIAGKGGAGKTHIAACVSRLFAREKKEVYAIDAVPGGNLGTLLGFSGTALAELKPIVDMRNFLDTGRDDGALYLSTQDFANSTGRFSLDANKLHFLKMTDVKHIQRDHIVSGAGGANTANRTIVTGCAKLTGDAGAFCYCEERRFLRTLIDSMLENENDAVVIDMSGGIEHLSVSVIRSADLLLIVTEPSRASIETARLIRAIGKELNISKIRIAANKVRGEKDEILIRASFHRDELFGVIRMSDSVADIALGMGNEKKPPLTGDLLALYDNLISN